MGKKHSKPEGQQDIPDNRNHSHVLIPGDKIVRFLTIPPYIGRYLSFVLNGFDNMAVLGQFLYSILWNEEWGTAFLLLAQLIPSILYPDSIRESVDKTLEDLVEPLKSVLGYNAISVDTFIIKWVAQVAIYIWVMIGHPTSTKIITWLFGYTFSFLVSLIILELRHLPLIGWVFIPLESLYYSVEQSSMLLPVGEGERMDGSTKTVIHKRKKKFGGGYVDD